MEKCIKCKNYEKEIKGCLYMDADCKNGEKFEPITNYDHIKSMSVEEMAEMLIEETEAPLSGEPFLRTPDGELFNEYEEQAKNKAILHTIQWLLQEVSEDE